MLQGIMQGTRNVKAMTTSDKLKKSSGDKERRKNRRMLKSKLKDELSTVSTATEIQGQEMMMIMKHVNLAVHGDRAVRLGQREQGEDRENTTGVRCETHHRGKLQPASPEASKNRCRCQAGANRWYGHQGKTTILCKLKLREVVTTIPTIVYNVETVEYKNLSLTVRMSEARTWPMR